MQNCKKYVIIKLIIILLEKDGEIEMSREAIQRIKEAEDQAAVLCRVAGERAAEMRKRIHTQGEEHCAQVERETEAEYAAQLEEIRRRALALEEKKCAEAEAEAARIEAAAEEKMEQAIHTIVWEIVERCQ